jgi:hypothetical protein
MRRAYLLPVFGNVWALSLFGLLLMLLGLVPVARAVLDSSHHPTTPGFGMLLLLVGAALLIAAPLLPRLAGAFEVSSRSTKVKANLLSMPSEALLAPPQPAEKSAMDERAVARAVVAALQEWSRRNAEDTVRREMEQRYATGDLRRRRAGRQRNRR